MSGSGHYLKDPTSGHLWKHPTSGGLLKDGVTVTPPVIPDIWAPTLHVIVLSDDTVLFDGNMNSINPPDYSGRYPFYQVSSPIYASVFSLGDAISTRCYYLKGGGTIYSYEAIGAYRQLHGVASYPLAPEYFSDAIITFKFGSDAL